jgi:hypothetical protein
MILDVFATRLVCHSPWIMGVILPNRQSRAASPICFTAALLITSLIPYEKNYRPYHTPD